jgi:hypothetical protein
MTDLQRIQDDVLDYMKTEGVDTKEAFGSRMSSPAVHEMLQTKLAALPHVGALNLFNAQGWLINSSEVWPIPDVTIVDRRFFRDFTSGQPAPDMIVEPVRSKVTGNWTTILARRCRTPSLRELRGLARLEQRIRHPDDPSRRHDHRPLSA